MSYQEVLAGVAQGTADLIEELFGLVPDRLSVDEFHEMAADLIAIARVRGSAAAEAAFRAFLEVATGVPHPLPVYAAPVDRERLLAAIGTILADDTLDITPRLVRLAFNEPVQAATWTFAEHITRSKRVSGWRRGIEPDACQLCVWWAREGRVWEASHPMPRHPGCTCHQIPVVNVETTNYQNDRQARQAADTNQQRARARELANQ